MITEKEVLTLEAGPLGDALVARHVMGWTSYTEGGDLWRDPTGRWEMGCLSFYTGPEGVTPRTPHRPFRPTQEPGHALIALAESNQRVTLMSLDVGWFQVRGNGMNMVVLCDRVPLALCKVLLEGVRQRGSNG